MFQIHAWPRILHFFKDPNIVERLGEYLDHVVFNYCANSMAAPMAAYYFATSDPRHLREGSHFYFYQTVMGTILDPAARGLPYPTIPNSDGAGEVTAVGEGVEPARRREVITRAMRTCGIVSIQYSLCLDHSKGFPS